MPFDCRHRQRFGPEACLSSCPAAPPVFQVVRVQRAADVPAPEPHLVDIAVLDMHHGWPNLGHDAIVQAMQNALCDHAGPLRTAGIGFRVVSYDLRRGDQVIPEPPGGRHALYVGPRARAPRPADERRPLRGSQGIREDPRGAELFALSTHPRVGSAVLLSVCHTFGVMCRWLGRRRRRAAGAEKGGKSTGVVENISPTTPSSTRGSRASPRRFQTGAGSSPSTTACTTSCREGRCRPASRPSLRGARQGRASGRRAHDDGGRPG